MTNRLSKRRFRNLSTLTILALALCALCAGAASARETDEGAWRRSFEAGLGVTGEWAALEEAGQGDVLKVDGGKAGPGLSLMLGFNLNPRLGLELELTGADHDTNSDEMEARQGLISLGLRYHLIESGAIRPYIYGGLAAVGTELSLRADEDVSCDIAGVGGLFGGGVRLAVSPRFQLDCGLKHAIIDFEDKEIVLGDAYAGNPVDKSGSNTRVQFALRFLF